MRWRESAERDKIEFDVKTLAVAVFFHAVYGVASRKVNLSTLSEAKSRITTHCGTCRLSVMGESQWIESQPGIHLLATAFVQINASLAP